MNHGNKRLASLWVRVKGRAHVGAHLFSRSYPCGEKDRCQKRLNILIKNQMFLIQTCLHFCLSLFLVSYF